MNNRISFKNSLLKSAAILTVAGVLSRLLGFYYRILLTKYVGATGVGLFQMCMPLAAFAFALSCSGFSISVSKFSASSPSYKWLFAGLRISVLISCLVSVLLFTNSSFIARQIFMEERCENLIRIISFALPFMCIHNCISNYFYSQKESFIPASSQLIEQFARIGSLLLFVKIRNVPLISAADALAGNIFGELAASLYCIVPLVCNAARNKSIYKNISCSFREFKHIIKFSLPINTNQTIMHLLESAEAILIPAILTLSGISKDDAISQFGIITGMALPLVMFPCTAANSFAVMLLPKVSDESHLHNTNNKKESNLRLCHTVKSTVSMCLNLGIISIFLFINYGARLGSMIFSQPSVYIYTCILAWLCPFLYLKISLGSILNGLGHTSLTCIINIVGIMIRLLFILVFIPHIGICGYLYGLLASNILVSLLYIFNIYHKLNILPSPFDSIIIPICTSVISIFSSRIICRVIFGVIIKKAGEPVILLSGAAICCIIYLLLFIREYRKFM